jgi:DNA repair protein RadA/Sms
LALALYSARTGTALPPGVAAAGELSLAGEVRPTTHLRRRIKAAADLGYPKTVSPEQGGVRRLSDAVKAVWG